MLYNKTLLPLAKYLRKEMTKQEKHLWYDFLQKYPIKIYKQRIIENYIVDFYCYKAKLIIELDGSQHYSEKGIKKDSLRTAELNKLGLYVIRYSNLDVDKNFDSVCQDIDRIIKERVSAPLSQLR